MSILKIILLLCFILATFVPTKHALHVFQQNRYETERLTPWIKENFKLNLVHAILPVLIGIIACVLSMIFFNSGGTVAQACILLVLFVVMYSAEKKKKYIKPLVLTARVIRQIVVMVILGLIVVLFVLLNDFDPYLTLLAYFLPWILLYPMSWITSPIEAMVRKSFLNDAKRILDEHKGLIKIGITGSFGKTTTKNIMQAMVSEQFNSLMTPASYNTPMGITRTIREMLKPIHQVFVCEMGADHVGDIEELMDFVHPTIGVVTSIGPQHLNTFGSQENITNEKMKMIEMLPKDGFGVLNYDNEFIRNYTVKNTVETVTYGVVSKDTDYTVEDIHYTQTGSSFVVCYKDERIPLETKLLGELNILNILSAVAVARHLGVSWSVIQKAVKQMKQVEHRLELKKINGYRFIDDAFNANPTGSAMALEVLGMMPNQRIIVTPGMIDLGVKQNEINEHFGTLMKGKVDTVILVGKNQTRPIYEGLQKSGFDMEHVLVVDKVQEAFAYVYTHATTKDTILLENDLPDAFNH